jgi:ABC-type xylose transport system permease subunit
MLSVIIRSVGMLCAIMLGVILLSVGMLSDFTPGVIMVRVIKMSVSRVNVVAPLQQQR